MTEPWQQSRHRAGEVTTRRVDPVAWHLALSMAGGDVQLLRVSDDGLSVEILNSAPDRLA